MDILEHWKNKEKFNEPCRGIQPNPAMGNWPPHYSTTTHCASKTAFIKKKKIKNNNNNNNKTGIGDEPLYLVVLTKLSEKGTVQSCSDQKGADVSLNHSYELLIRCLFNRLQCFEKYSKKNVKTKLHKTKEKQCKLNRVTSN